MKLTPITENVTQLTRFGLVNAFLVREPEGFTLIDTMVRGSAPKLIEAAARIDGDTAITRILITHAHDDHTGSVEALEKALPEAEVLAPERDAKLMRGNKTGEPGEPDGKLLGKYPPLDLTIDRELTEGDRAGSLEVVDAPGHSPGQIALLDTRTGVLLAADTYSGVGGVATTAGPYLRFPLPGFVTWHRPTALESAKKLRELKPAWLAFGHGKPVKDPVPAMDEAVERSS